MKTERLKHRLNLRNIGKFYLLLCVLLTFTSCGKDDSPEIELIVEPEVIPKTVYGQWEMTNGSLFYKYIKFVHFNKDNTIDILSEDNLGFKREYNHTFTVSENQLTMIYDNIYNYTLEGDVLNIIAPGGKTATLNRSSSVPNATNWTQSLEILSEGDLPWNYHGDIAFNGTHLLLGKYPDENNIGLINPTTLELEGEIITENPVYAMEVEKYDGPEKYIFQSYGFGEDYYDSQIFSAYLEDTNAEAFDSIDLDSYVIYGLASVDENQLWVAVNNHIDQKKKLYLYNYQGDHKIVKTIELGFHPNGLDYQNGFLYISDGRRIHKCQTVPDFRPIASYKIPNYKIRGIAFDGTNFWSNAYSDEEGAHKLVSYSL